MTFAPDHPSVHYVDVMSVVINDGVINTKKSPSFYFLNLSITNVLILQLRILFSPRLASIKHSFYCLCRQSVCITIGSLLNKIRG